MRPPVFMSNPEWKWLERSSMKFPATSKGRSMGWIKFGFSWENVHTEIRLNPMIAKDLVQFTSCFDLLVEVKEVVFLGTLIQSLVH